MGSISGRKALHVIENVEKILAIELLTATQAFEFRKPMKSGIILEEVHKWVRTKVAFANEDRVFADDIDKGIEMIRSAEMIGLVDSICEREDLSLSTPYSTEFQLN